MILYYKQKLKVYEFSKETKNKGVHINQYTKYDPTLPHVHTIKCPNLECDIIKTILYKKMLFI